MSFDRDTLLDAVRSHDRVVRVVIAAIKGSSPREVGASMLVWDDGQSGTIGGGALEYQAAQTARDLTTDTLTHHPLGPELGQCCGGTVTLLSEVYTQASIDGLPTDIIARGPEPQPLQVAKRLLQSRNQGLRPESQFLQGWMIEPVTQPSRHIWVWGAGHVGRAIVDVLAPLPDIQLTWIDTHRDRFPNTIAKNVDILVGTDPAMLARYAPDVAEHLILTYSHEIDFALCHTLLQHSFAGCGVIGSKTKWARFRRRLEQLGHGPAQIAQIQCPIGDPALGKHPNAIAIGVARSLLTQKPSACLTAPDQKDRA